MAEAVSPSATAKPSRDWGVVAARAKAIALAAAPAATLVVLNVLFRLPALINAAGVHSDAAIVGIEARHLLHGEGSWFLWGAGYQGILDVLLLAPAFAIFGSGPVVLMAVPLATHIGATLFAWDVLRRRLSPWRATILCLVLVFTPQAINGVVLYVPRQACITCVFAAIWFFDRASAARRPLLSFGAGAFMLVLALYADLFALQLACGAIVFAVLAWFDSKPGEAKPGVRTVFARVGVTLGVLVAGVAILWFLRHAEVSARPSPTGIKLDRIHPNLKLMLEDCLPWVLGWKVFIPVSGALYPELWSPPGWFHAVQLAGAAILIVSALSAIPLFFLRRLDWTVRRLGPLWFVSSAASISGFLVSIMPADMWSARYLAPLVWMAPFGLAPLAALVKRRLPLLTLAPYLVSAAVGGWLSLGPYVDGALPRRDPRGQAQQEREFGALLRSKGVHAGVAQYWLAYRLAYLWREDPVLVPFSKIDDRYAPWRDQMKHAGTYAYVFHVSEPRAQPWMVESQLQALHVPFERVDQDGFTALIVRAPGK